MGEGKFLYAIIDRLEKDDLPFTGINDAPLAVVCYRDLAAVISAIDLEQLAAGDEAWLKAGLVRYQQVNAALLPYSAVVPLRFGVTARDEEHVLEVLAKVYLHLRALLNRLRGRVELVVQTLWDLPKILEEIRQQTEGTLGHDSAVEAGRRLFEAAQARRTVYLTAIHERLAPLAEDFVDTPCHGDTMLMNRSYLVDTEKEPLFDAEMHRLGERYAGHLTFRYIGPLAPSSFANVKLTQGNFTVVDQARKTLQLGETATLDHIKAAYRRLMHAYHPDRRPGDALAAERCKAVIEAYEMLFAYCASCRPAAPDGQPAVYRFTPEAVERVFIVQRG